MKTDVSRMTFSFSHSSKVIFAQKGQEVYLFHNAYRAISELEDAMEDEHAIMIVDLGNAIKGIKGCIHAEVTVDFNSGWTSLQYHALDDNKENHMLELLFNVNSIKDYESAVFKGEDTAKIISRNMEKSELMTITHALNKAFTGI